MVSVPPPIILPKIPLISTISKIHTSVPHPPGSQPIHGFSVLAPISFSRRDRQIINFILHPHNICSNKPDLDALTCLTRPKSSRQILPHDWWPDIIRKGCRRNLGIIDIQGQVCFLGGYAIIIGDEDLCCELILPPWAKSNILAEVKLEIGRGGVVGDDKGVLGLVAWLGDVKGFVLRVIGVGRDNAEDTPWAKGASFEVAVFDDGKHVLAGRRRGGQGSRDGHGAYRGVDRCGAW